MVGAQDAFAPTKTVAAIHKELESELGMTSGNPAPDQMGGYYPRGPYGYNDNQDAMTGRLSINHNIKGLPDHWSVKIIKIPYKGPGYGAEVIVDTGIVIQTVEFPNAAEAIKITGTGVQAAGSGGYIAWRPIELDGRLVEAIHTVDQDPVSGHILWRCGNNVIRCSCYDIGDSPARRQEMLERAKGIAETVSRKFIAAGRCHEEAVAAASGNSSWMVPLILLFGAGFLGYLLKDRLRGLHPDSWSSSGKWGRSDSLQGQMADEPPTSDDSSAPDDGMPHPAPIPLGVPPATLKLALDLLAAGESEQAINALTNALGRHGTKGDSIAQRAAGMIFEGHTQEAMALLGNTLLALATPPEASTTDTLPPPVVPEGVTGEGPGGDAGSNPPPPDPGPTGPVEDIGIRSGDEAKSALKHANLIRWDDKLKAYVQSDTLKEFMNGRTSRVNLHDAHIRSDPEAIGNPAPEGIMKELTGASIRTDLEGRILDVTITGTRVDADIVDFTPSWAQAQSGALAAPVATAEPAQTAPAEGNDAPPPDSLHPGSMINRILEKYDTDARNEEKRIAADPEATLAALKAMQEENARNLKVIEEKEARENARQVKVEQEWKAAQEKVEKDRRVVEIGSAAESAGTQLSPAPSGSGPTPTSSLQVGVTPIWAQVKSNVLPAPVATAEPRSIQEAADSLKKYDEAREQAERNEMTENPLIRGMDYIAKEGQAEQRERDHEEGLERELRRLNPAPLPAATTKDGQFAEKRAAQFEADEKAAKADEAAAAEKVRQFAEQQKRVVEEQKKQVGEMGSSAESAGTQTPPPPPPPSTAAEMGSTAESAMTQSPPAKPAASETAPQWTQNKVDMAEFAQAAYSRADAKERQELIAKFAAQTGFPPDVAKSALEMSKENWLRIKSVMPFK